MPVAKKMVPLVRAATQGRTGSHMGRPCKKWLPLRTELAEIKKADQWVAVDLEKVDATEYQLRNTVYSYNRRSEPPPPNGCVWGVNKGDKDGIYYVGSVKKRVERTPMRRVRKTG